MSVQSTMFNSGKKKEIIKLQSVQFYDSYILNKCVNSQKKKN